MAMSEKDFKTYKPMSNCTADKIIECLIKAKGEGTFSMRAQEIAQQIKANPYTVSATLSELKLKGYVTHKKPEWSVNEEVVKGKPQQKNSRDKVA